jgi:predicted ATPase
MPIVNIEEIENESLPKQKPIKEIMSIRVPGMIDGIPNRNGMIWVLTGSGGSGKSSLLLNFFKSGKLYRNKYDNIYYVCPESSFDSVEKHPFSKHNKVYHELTAELLNKIYNELVAIKKACEDDQTEYNLLIIDDFADILKDKNIVKLLNKFLIKSRHLCVGVVFVLQSYYYFPKQLRKMITNLTIFKPKSYAEWESISKEAFDMSKDDSLILYHYIFDQPYAHLDVDTIDNTYYKNWNKLILTDSNDKI